VPIHKVRVTVEVVVYVIVDVVLVDGLDLPLTASWLIRQRSSTRWGTLELVPVVSAAFVVLGKTL